MSSAWRSLSPVCWSSVSSVEREAQCPVSWSVRDDGRPLKMLPVSGDHGGQQDAMHRDQAVDGGTVAVRRGDAVEQGFELWRDRHG